MVAQEDLRPNVAVTTQLVVAAGSRAMKVQSAVTYQGMLLPEGRIRSSP